MHKLAAAALVELTGFFLDETQLKITRLKGVYNRIAEFSIMSGRTEVGKP